MVWGFCYLRIFKKMHSISGRSLLSIVCPAEKVVPSARKI
jgi:hypothetical protein